ncbi:MAG: GTPase [Thermoguttaceae bacterium]
MPNITSAADGQLRVIQLTPPGRGAVATLRIEGPGAAAIVESHLQTPSGRPLAARAPDQLAVARFGGPNGEEVVVRRQGDDVVELHCHGGFAAVAMIEETLVRDGCQPAPWREWVANRRVEEEAKERGLAKGDSPIFAETKIGTVPETKNGALPVLPVAAAAMQALADARTERTAVILLDQYHGALGRALDEIEQAIGRGDVAAARQRIDLLLSRVPLGEHLVRPWRVVLAGRPNVGKSSLMNALAGHQRSIVHHEPGTTRDAVTLATAIDGWPVELCDTAGLRESGDALESAGVALAQERLAEADLVVLVFDQSMPWSADDQTLAERWPEAVVVYNKCDLPALLGKPAVSPGEEMAAGPSLARRAGGSSVRPGLMTSAARGDGIEMLLETIARRLVPDPPAAGAAVPFTTEQTEAIRALAQRVSSEGH